MMKACKCGSYAINHHCHGRDGSDDDLCDVCYWRKRAEQPAQQEKPTCKPNLQVWVIPNGKGGGQFSWGPQDERFWTRMQTAQPVPDETLLSFYQATDFPSLVSAMEGHIKKMQGKLQSNPHTAIDAWNNREMLRATPQAQPARERVGLSEEDREQHRNDWYSNIHDKEFRAIEAKLKEKNT